jgi:hypothetical protein
VNGRLESQGKQYLLPQALPTAQRARFRRGVTDEARPADITEFWAEYNARGDDEPSGTYTDYPQEDGRTADMPRYPAATLTLAGGPNDINHQRHYLVFVHGYNTSVTDARKRCSETYRRVFWTGFRGQMIGFLWHGDEARVIGSDVTLFDGNVQNALQTAPAFEELMTDAVGWAGSADKVDVIAHSLGNLVVWEAARLHQNIDPTTRIGRNYIMVEAAIWREAFNNKAAITYTTPDSAVTYPDTGTGSDVLQRHSWAFWFFQSAHDSSSAFSGITNSYNPSDSILLGAMRANDWFFRGSIPPVLGKHFYRELSFFPTNDRYRGTADIGVNLDEHRLENIPALMKPGHRDDAVYNADDLNEPIGAVSRVGWLNKNAQDYHWRDGQHSDAWAIDYDPSDVENRMWFPLIYNWYDKVVHPLISIGKD